MRISLNLSPAFLGAALLMPTAVLAESASAPNAFNPALSLILSGAYLNSSQDPKLARISGFAQSPDAEIGLGNRGFSLGETELGLAASIDPNWRGAANIALGADGGASVEEAFAESTGLGQGFTLKLGRFLSGIGYLNAQHTHTWDFADAPLAYQAMLGGQLGDDGMQLRWVAPTEQFIELGLELGRGRGFPGRDTARNGAGMRSVSLHTGGDWGSSHSWRAGVSLLSAQAQEQDWAVRTTAGADQTDRFSGRTRVTVLDGLWKWAPNGNATRQNFKLQGEWLQSRQTGQVVSDVDGAATLGDWRARASGGYVQAIYQFMPAWRVGLRSERLSAATPQGSAAYADLAGAGYHPRKQSLMLDYSASEFSRIRLQVAQDRSRQGATDRQIALQYQMSLGAHGAHSY